MTKEIVVPTYDNFDADLRRELAAIGHTGRVLVRNFASSLPQIDDKFEMVGGEISRLDIVRATGTDRDATSSFSNAPGHDYEHDIKPAGKSPKDIIYAFLVDPWTEPYTVHQDHPPSHYQVTTNMPELECISVYDADKLQRVARNEYWFTGKPLDALLLIFRQPQHK